ncbi:hypothetical protein ACH4MM_05415 [Streptomyces pratensis]|uniref:hypothetical protein n=1 Tax=Streptomyces pratensis TaxID=1169025 RepID=UPI0037BADDE9
MTVSQEFPLADGTKVRFLAEPQQPSAHDPEPAPDGIGPLVPVARRRQAATACGVRCMTPW